MFYMYIYKRRHAYWIPVFKVRLYI